MTYLVNTEMEAPYLFKLLQEIWSSYGYSHVDVMNDKQWLFLSVIWQVC